ncbi:hypothetical protein RFI_18843, partial [Reticulomyxa filosa]
ASNEAIINEFNARSDDLRRLNELFYNTPKEVRQSQFQAPSQDQTQSQRQSQVEQEASADGRDEILDEIIARNNDFVSKVQSGTGSRLVSNNNELHKVTEVNQRWQDEVLKMVHVIMFVKKQMLAELKERTNDLQTAISVLRYEKPVSILDTILTNNKQRHTTMGQALEELNKLITETESSRNKTAIYDEEASGFEVEAKDDEDSDEFVSAIQGNIEHENKKWEILIQDLQNVNFLFIYFIFFFDC